jgi:hypothetical protein
MDFIQRMVFPITMDIQADSGWPEGPRLHRKGIKGGLWGMWYCQLFFLCRTLDQTQDLVHARQVLYHLSRTS